jgi:hypothetical protein
VIRAVILAASAALWIAIAAVTGWRGVLCAVAAGLFVIAALWGAMERER